MTPFPRTAGELLAHLEAAGEADNWIVSTDMADARDQYGSLRRTFRLRALGDAPCAVLAEYGSLFVLLSDFDVTLANLYRPRLRDVVAPWATSDHGAFVDALERLFPCETYVANI